MKTLVTAALLALSLSACAGFADSSRGSTVPASQSVSSEKDYGMRDATREYPYNPAQY